MLSQLIHLYILAGVFNSLVRDTENMRGLHLLIGNFLIFVLQKAKSKNFKNHKHHHNNKSFNSVGE